MASEPGFSFERCVELGSVNQTLQTLWTKHSDDEARRRQCTATVQGLIGIAPRDELEGMIAAHANLEDGLT